MITIKCFVFSPFSENTFVLHDETNQAVIIDPGCYGESEEAELSNYIKENKLSVSKLLNTHCHIDHVFGNHFVAEKYGLQPVIHKEDLWTLNEMTPTAAKMYGLDLKLSPQPKQFIEQGDIISFGNSTLEVRFTPGHAPGHVVFVNHEQKFVINGDCLFEGSIGRTDFPKSDFDTLINSIKTQLYTLDDDFIVYTGHGNPTTVGKEKRTNPFVK